MGNSSVIKSRLYSPSVIMPEGGGSSGPMAIMQLRTTAVVSATSSFQQVDFDTTDFESDTAVMEADGSGGITVKETAVYEITYDLDLLTPPANYITEFTGRVKSDSNVVVGSSALAATFYDNAVAGGTYRSHLGKSFFGFLGANTTLTFEIKTEAQAGTAEASIKPNAIITAKRIPS